MTNNTKRWLRSTAETFVSGFLVTMSLQLDSITSIESITTSLLMGVFFACARGGLKAAIESYLGYKGGKNGS